LLSVTRPQVGTTMEVNGHRHLFVCQHSLKYLLLFSAEERNSYTFGKLEVNYPLNGVAREKMWI